jgi:hypothetical protein
MRTSWEKEEGIRELAPAERGPTERRAVEISDSGFGIWDLGF